MNKHRQVGLVVVIGVLVQQFAFALFSQSCGIFSMLLVGGIVLIPTAAFLISRTPLASVAACIALMPFLVWANNSECIQPYSGGGASMAYVVVFLFGIPASVIAGGLVCAAVAIKSG
jgi:hypothetical protein